VKHNGGGALGGAMPFNLPNNGNGNGSKGAATPASIEEAASHPQMPRPDQRLALSTRRVVSNIPRADELRNPVENRPASAAAAASGDNAQPSSAAPVKAPAATCAPHQPPQHTKWVYPSEQQFYNALRRKGWQPDESTIPDVVRIHNAVNERGWSEVRKWEALRGNDHPRLVRFMGRPKDLSPRAWFNSRVLWYTEPFDRHDWYVDGGGDGSKGEDKVAGGAAGADGSVSSNAGSGHGEKQEEPRRYVIDFYSGESGGGDGAAAADAAADATTTAAAAPGTSIPPRPPSMYIDVRPALDGPDAVVDRMKMFVRDAFPGLSAAFGMDGGGDRGGGSTSSSTGTRAGANASADAAGGGANGSRAGAGASP